MFSTCDTPKIGYASREAQGEEPMRRLISRFAGVAVLAAIALLPGGRAEATPIAVPGALRAASGWVALSEQAQFIYLGRPYCWYPYGWAGAGWYWCGYGTRAGLGWGGEYGWNGWIAPRSYGTMRAAPGYRFRHYR
jgi:hypothetical protein